jgi:hypothetical protein
VQPIQYLRWSILRATVYQSLPNEWFSKLQSQRLLQKAQRPPECDATFDVKAVESDTEHSSRQVRPPAHAASNVDA